jgi:hypothetical protein
MLSSGGSNISFGKAIGCLPNYTLSNPTKNHAYSHCYETHLTSGSVAVQNPKFSSWGTPTALCCCHRLKAVRMGSRLFLELPSFLSCSFIRQLLDSRRFTKYSACIPHFCLRIPESKIQLTESHSSEPPCRLTLSWSCLYHVTCLGSSSPTATLPTVSLLLQLCVCVGLNGVFRNR